MKIGFGTQLWLRDNHFENFHRMLDEMSMLELDGFEMMYEFLYETYKNRKKELRKLLDIHQLELSNYYVPIAFSNEDVRRKDIEYAHKIFEFVSDMGYQNVFIDERYHLRDLKTENDTSHTDLIADTANELGEYANSLGLQLSWHQHWGSYFEVEDRFHRFMEQTDEYLVSFCCDSAQILMCGWDLLAIVRKYAKRMKYVHYKDIEFKSIKRNKLWDNGPEIPSDSGVYNVDSKARIVELGRGEVNFKDMTRILLDSGFDGWVVDDCDYTCYSVMESVKSCVDYLNGALGIYGERQARISQEESKE